MITIDYDSSRRMGQIITDPDTLGLIRNHFSVPNMAKKFSRKRTKFIKDRRYVITPAGRFPFGMYNEIRKFLIKSQITDIHFTQEFKKHLQCGLRDVEVVSNLKYDPRYYQVDTVKAALKVGRGICLLATSAGKSLCQALLIENFKLRHKGPFKCLVVVPGVSLVEQLCQDFEDYGVSFTYSGWTGNIPLQDTEVVVVNTQYLNRAFGDNPWIVDVDILLVDECHGVNDESDLVKLISKIRTRNRFGFTGTLSDKPMDSWRAIGEFGPVIYEKNSKELRDEGFVTSKVKLLMLKLIHPVGTKITNGYRGEVDFLYTHQRRNEVISGIVSRLPNNTLVLVNSLAQGEALKDMMSNEGRDVFFVEGKMVVDDREAIKAKMESSDNVVCVAMAAIFSTGINIKNLHNILFVAGGKSFVRTVQSIGRGLRLHSSKSSLTIIDVYDTLTYAQRHADARKNIYKTQQIEYKEAELIL